MSIINTALQYALNISIVTDSPPSYLENHTNLKQEYQKRLSR